MSNKSFTILVVRRSMKSAKVIVKAKNYYNAVELALSKARDGDISWNEEKAIVQHDCENIVNNKYE